MPSAISAPIVVAVSGGVDSVVLLDALVRKRAVYGKRIMPTHPAKVIVAHFDHGIRSDSASDAEFVANLAISYGCEFRTKREELGDSASEEVARMRRYAFLGDVCREFDAILMTAHHMNDINETVAINIIRGTGWRGLAPMDSAHISRPLLGATKQDIVEYAVTHGLQWREDNTNTSDTYLRNRLRKQLTDHDTVLQIAALRARQVELKRSIDEESERLVGRAPYSRYVFTHCGDTAAIELLRVVFLRETGMSPTITIRKRVLHAIKVAKPGSVTHVWAGVTLRFTRTEFIVEKGDKVLS